MTRKDYEAFAKIIREHQLMKSHPRFVTDLAEMLKELNPRFDVALFVLKCRDDDED